MLLLFFAKSRGDDNVTVIIFVLQEEYTTGRKTKYLLIWLRNSKLPNLYREISQISQCPDLALQWISAHCGVPVIEKSDKLAKLGTKSDQPINTYCTRRKLC